MTASADVVYWINQAKKNAEKDLDKWPEIVNSGTNQHV